MDKKILTVVVIVVILLATLTIYFLNRIASLEQKTSQLELELQIVAKKEFQIEQVHAQAIKNLAGLVQKPHYPTAESNPAPASIIRPPAPVNSHQPYSAVARAPVPVPAPMSKQPHKHPKKVTFSDHDEDEDDESFLEREFATHDHEEDDSNRDEESSEPEEPPPPKPAITKKSKKPARRPIVSSSKAPPERRNSSGMDETRAMAEKLRKEAGADVE